MAIFTDGDIYGLLGVYGYIAFILLISHLLKRHLKNPRKLVHILTGGIVFFWWSFDTPWVMSGLAAFPFIPILMLFTPISPFKNLRESSLGSISHGGHPYGLVMYAISWTVIAYFLFHDLVSASIAIASMSFGDGMGEIIGKRYGKHKYLPGRSLEGSAAVFFASLIAISIICLFYFNVLSYLGGSHSENLFFFASSVALFVACLEAITPGMIDNLVIPLVVALFLHMLGV